MSEKKATKEGTLHIKIGHLDMLLRDAEQSLNLLSQGDGTKAGHAMLTMRHILNSMEPKDRATLSDLERKVTEEYTALMKSRSMTLKTRRIQLRFDIYIEWLKKIQDALWEGGYWSNEKYGFHDLSGGKKS